jgi:adenylate cyclase
MERRLAAILAADVVGYSRLMAADEKGTHARLKALRQDFIEPKINEHHGRVVKLMGDGALVEFGSVVDAVECAAAIQKGVAERQAELPEDQRIDFRIGINVGDIIIEDDDIYGDGVNIAARLEQLAEPGSICVSRNVYNQVKNKVAFGFEPMGEHRVKNIPEPVVAYRVMPDPGPVAGIIGPRRAGPRWRRPALAATTLVVLALAGGGLVALYHRQEAPVEAGSGQVDPLPLPAKPSIAVLPFANLSNDPAQDYFVDGITNDIITDLSKFSTLFVVAANSTFRYKGQAVKMQDVARDLGVRYVLEGSVQRAADVLRVNAQLVDATTGHHVWAERYDRPTGDLFAVQHEMTRQIAGLIASERGGPVTKTELERTARRSTQNLSAYEYFLRGVGHRNLETKEDTQLAREMFEKASQIDPRYARAIANLSLTYQDEIWGDWTASRERSLAKSEELARRAIEIDPSEPLGYMVLGLAYQLRGKANQAILLIEKAQALNPNDVHIKHGLASTLAYAGSPEQAIALLKEAQRLDPYYPEVILRDLGQAQFFARRYRDALATFSGITHRHRTSYWLYVAASHAQLEQLDEARAAIEEARKLNPKLTLEREIRRRVENGLAPASAEHLRAALRKAGLPETLSASGLKERRIAVLPFVNMSADAENEYFSNGITEELISQRGQSRP